MKLITELEGRELDAAVAEEVMGYRWAQGLGVFLWHPGEGEPNGGWVVAPKNPGGDAATCYVPRFRTDIAAAWHVVKKLREKRGVEVSIESNGDRWWVDITDGTSGTFDSSGSYDRVLGQAGGDTIGEAICRAALEAVRRV